MAKYIYKGVDRYNQLHYDHETIEGIVAVIDRPEIECLTIYTKDEKFGTSEAIMNIQLHLLGIKNHIDVDKVKGKIDITYTKESINNLLDSLQKVIKALIDR